MTNTRRVAGSTCCGDGYPRQSGSQWIMLSPSLMSWFGSNNGLVPFGSVVLLSTGWQDKWEKYAFLNQVLEDAQASE